MHEKSKTKKIILLIVVAVLSCSLFSCAQNEAEKTVLSYFNALNDLDFTKAGEYLGNKDAYSSIINETENESSGIYEQLVSKQFVSIVYKNVSIKIIKTEQQGDICLVSCIVSAYSTDEINEFFRNKTQSVLQSEAYINSEESDKYIMLCESVENIFLKAQEQLVKKDTEITIKVKKDNDAFVIIPEKQLFDAISGL